MDVERTKPHIVILTSATGGGHDACAAALRHAFQTQHGDAFRITVVDLWSDHAPWLLNLCPRGYSFFINRLPLGWILLWHALANPRVDRLIFGLIGRWIRPQIEAAFRTLQPDLIIAVHPLVQRAVRQALRASSSSGSFRHIPWFTVVTDLATPHPLWFDPDAERCFVPTDEAAHIAITSGIPLEKLAVVGLPSYSSPAFAVNGHLHQMLNWPLQSGNAIGSTGKNGLYPTPVPSIILVMGGAEGMGPLRRIAQAIDAQFGHEEYGSVRMVIVCGTNERLRAALTNQQWSMPVSVVGFIDNVQALMAASSLLVTKAGPSTITEALNAELPILLAGYLPGQEEGNVDYVVDNGVGLYCPRPEQIGQTARRLLVENPGERLAIAARARHLSRPNAAIEIANQIAHTYINRRKVSSVAGRYYDDLKLAYTPETKA